MKTPGDGVSIGAGTDCTPRAGLVGRAWRAAGATNPRKNREFVAWNQFQRRWTVTAVV
jgi:hypothetical protein